VNIKTTEVQGRRKRFKTEGRRVRTLEREREVLRTHTYLYIV